MIGSRWLVTVLMLSLSLPVSAAGDDEEGVLRVKPSIENFRDAPNGKKLGTLLQDTAVERISQKGEWVRFRVEGWVWGPSLEGFRPEVTTVTPTPPDPSLPLRDAVPRIRRVAESLDAAFYSLELDADLGRLTLRIRVHDLDPDALSQRQLALQKDLLAILPEDLGMEVIRVESNRGDGSGRVGVEIVETPVARLGEFDRTQVSSWKQVSRISHDGGDTWIRVE